MFINSQDPAVASFSEVYSFGPSAARELRSLLDNQFTSFAGFRYENFDGDDPSPIERESVLSFGCGHMRTLGPFETKGCPSITTPFTVLRLGCEGKAIYLWDVAASSATSFRDACYQFNVEHHAHRSLINYEKASFPSASMTSDCQDGEEPVNLFAQLGDRDVEDFLGASLCLVGVGSGVLDCNQVRMDRNGPVSMGLQAQPLFASLPDGTLSASLPRKWASSPEPVTSMSASEATQSTSPVFILASSYSNVRYVGDGDRLPIVSNNNWSAHDRPYGKWVSACHSLLDRVLRRELIADQEILKLHTLKRVCDCQVFPTDRVGDPCVSPTDKNGDVRTHFSHQDCATCGHPSGDYFGRKIVPDGQYVVCLDCCRKLGFTQGRAVYEARGVPFHNTAKVDQDAYLASIPKMIKVLNMLQWCFDGREFVGSMTPDVSAFLLELGIDAQRAASLSPLHYFCSLRLEKIFGKLPPEILASILSWSGPIGLEDEHLALVSGYFTAATRYSVFHELPLATLIAYLLPFIDALNYQHRFSQEIACDLHLTGGCRQRFHCRLCDKWYCNLSDFSSHFEPAAEVKGLTISQIYRQVQYLVSLCQLQFGQRVFCSGQRRQDALRLRNLAQSRQTLTRRGSMGELQVLFGNVIGGKPVVLSGVHLLRESDLRCTIDQYQSVLTLTRVHPASFQSDRSGSSASLTIRRPYTSQSAFSPALVPSELMTTAPSIYQARVLQSLSNLAALAQHTLINFRATAIVPNPRSFISTPNQYTCKYVYSEDARTIQLMAENCRLVYRHLVLFISAHSWAILSHFAVPPNFPHSPQIIRCLDEFVELSDLALLDIVSALDATPLYRLPLLDET
jgi:hypothetical protein